jgi:hypothetical protein
MVKLYPETPPTEQDIHIERNMVEIRKSSIPGAGSGVFAKVDIPNGYDLGLYRGEALTEKEFEDRYGESGHGEYTLYLPDKTYVDAAKTGYNWTSRMNAPRGLGKKSNIWWDQYGRTFARRNIKAGEELLVGYGTSYWSGDKKNNKRKTIKKKK